MERGGGGGKEAKAPRAPDPAVPVVLCYSVVIFNKMWSNYSDHTLNLFTQRE